SVVLLGPQPPWRWGPPPERPWHRAVWRGVAGDDAGVVPGAPHPALARVTLDDVLAAVADALAVGPPRRPAGGGASRGEGRHPGRLALGLTSLSHLSR